MQKYPCRLPDFKEGYLSPNVINSAKRTTTHHVLFYTEIARCAYANYAFSSPTCGVVKCFHSPLLARQGFPEMLRIYQGKLRSL